MSTLTPSELLNQLISNANAAKAKALQDAADLKAKIEAEQAEAKKLVDALSIANQFGAVHQASVDRLVELETATTRAKTQANAEFYIIEQVKANFISAQNLLNNFDEAKAVQEANIAAKDELDFLSNFLVEQMKSRGL